jgi:cytochrome c oxidase subunit 2
MGALIGAVLLFLSACDVADKDQIGRLAMPEPATEQAPYTLELWRWAWLAAMITGVLVWGLIFWAVVKYRRRSDDEVPVQTRYNLPLEIFYTIAPIMMVIVFFYWTVNVQNKVVAIDPEPDVTVEVVGFQWSWTFNHGVGPATGSPTLTRRRRNTGTTTTSSPWATSETPRRWCCRSTRRSSSTCTRPT